MTRLQAAGVDLVALFSPEHGFRGAADPGATVASSIDSATGLPIYSLYGRTSAPTDAMLDGRRAAAGRSAGRRRAILHVPLHHRRGDAVGGAAGHPRGRARPARSDRRRWCRGTCSTPRSGRRSGMLAVPMRHGMTLGELARLARADLGLATDLRRRAGAGWRRPMPLDATGLPFVPPSPNLRSLESLSTIPGLCLFEGTNLAWAAARRRRSSRSARPGSTPRRCCARVRAAALAGVRFAGVTLHAQPAGRRQVRRYAARRHPARGHRPGHVRSDRHGRAPAGRGARGPRRPVRLDPEALRPVGRRARAARAARGGHGAGSDRAGMGGGAGAVQGAAAAVSAVSGVVRPSSSLRSDDDALARRPFPADAPVSNCPNQFWRLSFRPAARPGIGRLTRLRED